MYRSRHCVRSDTWSHILCTRSGHGLCLRELVEDIRKKTFPQSRVYLQQAPSPRLLWRINSEDEVIRRNIYFRASVDIVIVDHKEESAPPASTGQRNANLITETALLVFIYASEVSHYGEVTG